MKLLSQSEISAALRITPEIIGAMTPDEVQKYLAALEVVDQHLARNRFHYRMYPETGPRARRLYAKHMEFFEAGSCFRERCAMCANRVGKTYGMGGYETTCHLTGQYPDWWPGKRFDRPILAWAAGKTAETTRDIVQKTLLGSVVPGNPKGFDGTGMIPGDLIGRPTWKAGATPDLADTIPVRHVSGGLSYLGLKSYAQGRGAFEGTAVHVIWLDEEPPMDIYSECLLRTATIDGTLMLTFTPLEGMSQVVLQFMPADQRPS